MKFTAAVIAALCAAVLATPAPVPARNIAKNKGLARKSRLNRADHFWPKRSSNDSGDDFLEKSWAGVAVVPSTGNGTIVGVSAYIVLPNITNPTDGAQVDAEVHTSSTWVGIDGFNCDSGLWQAGVDGSIDKSGVVSWYAWYEWYPADTIAIDLGDLAVGDVSLHFVFYAKG